MLSYIEHKIDGTSLVTTAQETYTLEGNVLVMSGSTTPQETFWDQAFDAESDSDRAELEVEVDGDKLRLKADIAEKPGAQYVLVYTSDHLVLDNNDGAEGTGKDS